VRLIDHTLELLRPNQAARDLGALEQHRLDTIPPQAVGKRATGQPGPDDQDSAHARNATGRARQPQEMRFATMPV
jgi:hypothetical protein